MAKDPAFLFYPSDWISGTMGMTFEEKGAYMELLMYQFNQGHMSGHMIARIVGKHWETIKHKFKQDDNGNWYNVRLELEKEKRKTYSESRRNNLKGNNQYTKKGNKKEAHMVSHMENEDINEIKDIIDYLNITCKTSFKYSKNSIKHINARLKDGFSPDEIKDVIDFKFKQWGNDPKMSEYLRPETLFGSKFESYLNASKVKIEENKGIIDLTKINFGTFCQTNH